MCPNFHQSSSTKIGHITDPFPCIESLIFEITDICHLTNFSYRLKFVIQPYRKQISQMIKRSPSLTEQTKTHIKQLIVDDEFANGRIPSETILADQFGVSRTTVRDALGRLEHEGVLYRKQGAGTFVNKPGLQIKSKLDEIWSYEAMLKAHDYVPSVRILSADVEKVDEETAVSLNLAPDDEVLVVKKLFLEDDEPVILTHNIIPVKLLRDGYTDADLLLPVYEFLEKNGRLHLSYYVSEIIPVITSDELGAILHIPPQTPLLTFSEIGYNENNDPILKSKSGFRDDLIRLRLIRRR